MKYLKRFNESFPGDNIEATIINGNIIIDIRINSLLPREDNNKIIFLYF